MTSREPSPGLPPSGGWSGYYLYGFSSAKHRMKMTLTFSPAGRISGGGIDDVAPFTIHGVFDSDTNQASWTKTYIGMHRVEYQGLYDHRSICGSWNIGAFTGGFWIWPDGIAESEKLAVELEQPVEEQVPRSTK